MRARGVATSLALVGCGRIEFGLISDDARPMADIDMAIPADVPIDGPSRFGQLMGTSSGRSIALAPNGDIVMAGWVSTSVDAGGGALPYVAGKDALVARYSPSGEHQWSKTFGSNADDAFQDVYVDGNDNVYLAGFHEGTIDVGGGALTTGGNLDGLIVSLAGDGTYRWAREIESTDVSALDSAWSIREHGGRVFVSGLTLTASTVGGTLFTCGGTSQAMLVAAFGTDGSVQWGKCLGAGGFNSARGLTVDGAGNVTITGYYDGAPNLGGGALPTSNGLDAFVASFDGDGNHRWSRAFGGGVDDWGNRITSDAAGNVFASGLFGATVDFGGGARTATGSIDGYVVSFTVGGAYRWDAKTNGSDCDQVRDVGIDSAGNVYAAGHFAGSLTFASKTLVAMGGGDGFILEIANANGAGIDATQVGGAQNDEVQDLAFSVGGMVAVGRSDTSTSQCRNQPDSADGELFLLRL